jgi:hypothetical protein
VRVEEALDMPARERRRGLAGLVHQGGVPDEDFIRALAMTDPRLVRLLAVPRPRALGAIDLVHERVLPTRADLGHAHRTTCPAVEAEEDRRGVLGRDVALDRLDRAVRGEGLDRPGGFATRLDERRQVGHHRLHVLAGDIGHEIEPVRADVAHGAERPAAIGLEPPVPVALEEQPILEVAAGDEPDLAQAAVGDQRSCVLVQRVEADVEVRRVDETRLGGQGDQPCRLVGGHREWLLADDMLARPQRGLRLAEVEVVRRRDVDGGHAVVREELLERGVRLRHAERVGTCRATFRGAAEHADHVHADAA